MESSYLFEDLGTNRHTELISEYTLKDLSNYIAMTRLPKLKVSW